MFIRSIDFRLFVLSLYIQQIKRNNVYEYEYDSEIFIIIFLI